ncbi:MAG: benenodin family lasso peptide [Rhodanobacter sp.]
MNTNENIRTNTPEEVIVLGVASVETLGGGGTPNEAQGFIVLTGLSDN